MNKKKIIKLYGIRASGSNSAVLCYINNNKDMKNDGIYLTDMGIKFLGMA